MALSSTGTDERRRRDGCPRRDPSTAKPGGARPRPGSTPFSWWVSAGQSPCYSHRAPFEADRTCILVQQAPFAWPSGFDRIPDEPWTRQPVEDLAKGYDTVEHHGWYANLDATVAELDALVESGDVVVDYSGGTGILIDRVLAAIGNRGVGFIDVDSSPKFLRLALQKLESEPRVAFRLIRFMRESGKLELLHEVLGPLAAGRVDALCSTNAIHLYYDLDETLASWARVLRPGGTALVQSGNIRRADPMGNRWIIDETVEAIHAAAMSIVRDQGHGGTGGAGGNSGYAAYRDVLDDPGRMAGHDQLRRKYFLPVRPVGHYRQALEAAGLRVRRVEHRPIEARVDDWYDFLAVYHEGVLGWVGGTAKVEGRPATPAAIQDRLQLMREAMDLVFDGQESFTAEWTYLSCERA